MFRNTTNIFEVVKVQYDVGATVRHGRVMTPCPSFPQIQSADLGERELRVWMKREIINSDYEMRLASRWWLQSTTGDKVRRFVLYGSCCLFDQTG
jgi:hypothetical protein